MILIGGALLGASLLSSQPQQVSQSQDPAPVVRRLAATSQLAAQEYRVGVENGRIIARAEVDEARLFLQESRRSAALLPRATVPYIHTVMPCASSSACSATVGASWLGGR